MHRERVEETPSRGQDIMLYFYLLCYAAVLLTFTCYAQEQELSDHYGIYIQFCISNSLHVTESFIKTVLLECINE